MNVRWTSNDPERRLGIYLDDHRAGAAGGAALARRILDANPDNYLTATMRELTDEIDRDRQLLENVMRRLGHAPNRLKVAVAAVGEKFARLKANGHLRRYSPLSRLEESEMLSAGIMTKASLWRCCEIALSHRPEIADIDFGDLRERAESQRARLEAHRGRIVEDAFSTGGVTPPEPVAPSA
jgi:hypothetical protein